MMATVYTADVSPFGLVTLEVSGARDIVVDVTSADIPNLPEGMAVDGVLLFSVRLGSPVVPGVPLRWRLTADRDGHAETGEYLDSMAFESDQGILQLAIRDDEWLESQGIAAETVRYEDRGFSQTISKAPAKALLQASEVWRRTFGVIENDASTWFAADLALP